MHAQVRRGIECPAAREADRHEDVDRAVAVAEIGPHVSESVAPGIAVLMSPTNVQLRKSADLISAKDACRP